MQGLHTQAREISSILTTATQMARRFGRVGLSEVEDIVQDAMIKVLAKTDGRPISDGWLFTVVRSAACDAGRKRARENQYFYTPDCRHIARSVCELADEDGSVRLNGRTAYTRKATEPDVLPRVDKLLELLKPPVRHALILRVQGYSYEEIALATGAKLGTVRSRLHYARKKMNGLMGDQL